MAYKANKNRGSWTDFLWPVLIVGFLLIFACLGMTPQARKANEAAWQARNDVCPLSETEAYTKWGGDAASSWSQVSRDTWAYSGAKAAVRVPEFLTYEVGDESNDAGLSGTTVITSQLTLQCRVDR